MSKQYDSDHQLDELLRSLPRVSASPGFADRVVRELHSPAKSHRGRWTALVAAACTIVLAVALLPGGETPRRGHDLTALDAEYRRLAAELESLETLHARVRPVVYLGSGGQTDFVLDLDRLARRRTARAHQTTTAGTGRFEPARFEKGDHR